MIEDGEEFLHADWLVFIQDEGPQAAVVSLYSAHTPWAVSTVDLVTVAEEISNNIANR